MTRVSMNTRTCFRERAKRLLWDEAGPWGKQLCLRVWDAILCCDWYKEKFNVTVEAIGKITTVVKPGFIAVGILGGAIVRGQAGPVLPPRTPVVVIHKIADHPALDATVQGIIDGLIAQGYAVQGNVVTSKQPRSRDLAVHNLKTSDARSPVYSSDNLKGQAQQSHALLCKDPGPQDALSRRADAACVNAVGKRSSWETTHGAFCSGINQKKAACYLKPIPHKPSPSMASQGWGGLDVKNQKSSGHTLDLGPLIVRVDSAKSDPVLARQLAAKHAGQEIDVVVTLGTPSAQSFLPYAIQGRSAHVFSSVTDPLGAGLVKTLACPGNNTTGVSNFVDVVPQVRLMRAIQPSLRRLGIIYNPGEANAVKMVHRLREVCGSSLLPGITLVPQAIVRTTDVAQATARLASRVDAIFISNDNTALSTLPVIAKIAGRQDRPVPVYVSDTDAVPLGALAALGPNQYNVGQQTAELVRAVLKGHRPGTLPVAFPSRCALWINHDAAAHLGVAIPKAISAQAYGVIMQGKPREQSQGCFPAANVGDDGLSLMIPSPACADELGQAL